MTCQKEHEELSNEHLEWNGDDWECIHCHKTFAFYKDTDWYES